MYHPSGLAPVSCGGTVMSAQCNLNLSHPRHSRELADDIFSLISCISSLQETAFLTNVPNLAVTMSSHSLSSFTLFPHLPLELQHQIWFYTLPGPRLLRIDYSPILSNGQYATTKSLDLYTTFPRCYGRQLPIILRINKASREYALTQLVERFNCYWNLKIDIPYIHAREYRKSEARFTMQYLAENGGLEGFRNLALDVDLLNGGDSSDM